MLEGRLKILVTNDDGINAPGLWAAVRALRPVGEVFVVAPESEQSGVGSALTLHAPVGARSVEVDPARSGDGSFPDPVTAFAVSGTPGDSSILGLEQLVGAVDLVVSGINSGSNLGWDVMVSGTVGAALQGYVRGYRTIAVSVGAVLNPKFETAAQVLQLVAERLTQNGPDLDFFLNINVPNLPLQQISGIQVTRLGRRSYGESVREEGFGPDKKYRIARNRPIGGEPAEDTDIWAAKHNRISITPMQLPLGHQEQAPLLESLISDIPGLLLPHLD
jgi:5'-nucleotidase